MNGINRRECQILLMNSSTRKFWINRPNHGLTQSIRGTQLQHVCQGTTQWLPPRQEFLREWPWFKRTELATIPPRHHTTHFAFEKLLVRLRNHTNGPLEWCICYNFEGLQSMPKGPAFWVRIWAPTDGLWKPFLVPPWHIKKVHPLKKKCIGNCPSAQPSPADPCPPGPPFARHACGSSGSLLSDVAAVRGLFGASSRGRRRFSAADSVHSRACGGGGVRWGTAFQYDMCSILLHERRFATIPCSIYLFFYFCEKSFRGFSAFFVFRKTEKLWQILVKRPSKIQ